MKVIGYIRVSNEKQDFESQKHLLLEYAHQHKLINDELMSIEMSSRKDTKDRRIDELQSKLSPGDTLLVAELSRLGRNMLETLIIINALSKKRSSSFLSGSRSYRQPANMGSCSLLSSWHLHALPSVRCQGNKAVLSLRLQLLNFSDSGI